ncbi:MAG: HupE/UreJ family protein [Pseudomonadota bacterium]
MRRPPLSLVLTLALIFHAPQAFAHPGAHHGGLLDSLAHLLSQPDHLVLMVLAVAGGVLGARLFLRRPGAGSRQPRREV